MKTLCILAFFAVAITSCRKESFISSPDARVRLTADTLHFDTVFTTAGSVTQAFKIVNENDRKLRISGIRLKGGSNSFFRINADGIPGPDISGLELDANDSTYVFVLVSIDPNASALPFVVRDSIEITYNGVARQVQLEAWGQNAHFHRNLEISGSQSWSNDLPHVVLGSLYIDTNAVLTINKGTRVYLHADAPVIVDGTLLVNGEKDTADRVYFRGDRMDEPYRDFPASWPGIYFRATSRDNVLNYAVIRNAYQAIGLEEPSPNANPKLLLNQCIIDNAYDAGIIALHSSLTAVNTLVSNCGKNLVLVRGGDYDFNHCTIASYSNSYILHREPVLLLTNFVTVNNLPVTADLDAVFRNCIFWGENGTVDNEVVVARSGTNTFNVLFDHGIIKSRDNPANSTLNQIIFNQPPMFDSIDVSGRYYSFRLKPGSPAIDEATPTSVGIDLDGNPRPVGTRPDLGVYEKQ